MIRVVSCIVLLACPAAAQDTRERLLDPEFISCTVLHLVAMQPEMLTDDIRFSVQSFILGASVGIDPELSNPVAVLVSAETVCRANPELSLLEAVAAAAKTLGE